MELFPSPTFLPLNLSSLNISQWKCGITNRTHTNTYYKSLEGDGQILLQNGCKYEGQIKNGLMHGKGVFTWANGLAYTGEFRLSKISGIGRYGWPDGSYYQGKVVEGRREGYGTFWCASEKYMYTGQWKGGVKEGKGKIQYKDQSVYEGCFSKDQRNGWGKMTYSSKNQYEGEWKNDKKEGKGTMNWLNAHERYSGEWKQDLQDGYGEYFWCDNKTEYKIFKNTYKGYWKKGKRSGFGSFFYSNGCRFEGYFFENLKQGPGITIDQFGMSKLQQFNSNRPALLPQKKGFTTESVATLNKDHQNEKKLPIISSKNHSKQDSLADNGNGQNLTAEYRKFIDFQHPQLNQNFYNMLLRCNSKLRNLYKVLGASNSSLKDFYSGMVLQNYWKALRQCRLLSENYSLVGISREWSKGNKYYFDVGLPDQGIIDSLKRRLLSQKQVQYQEVLWMDYYEKIEAGGMICWSNIRQNVQKIDRWTPTSVDIHHPSNIVLFRHFVCLIIHTAILMDDSSKPLRDKVETLITSLDHPTDSNPKTQKCQQTLTQTGNPRSMSVPEWVKQAHEELLDELEPRTHDFEGRIDTCMPVRKMYSMLELGGIFKDGNDKMLYLERIQRYLNIRNSLLKKEYRGMYPELEKCVKENPYFGYLMNYEMNLKEIHQFLFLCISKKFLASSQQQFQQKYRQILKSLLKQTQLTKKTPHPLHLHLKTKKPLTQKDIMKSQLAVNMQKRKEIEEYELWARRQVEREELERVEMAREDFDAEDVAIQSQQEEEDYYG